MLGIGWFLQEFEIEIDGLNNLRQLDMKNKKKRPQHVIPEFLDLSFKKVQKYPESQIARC